MYEKMFNITNILRKICISVIVFDSFVVKIAHRSICFLTHYHIEYHHQDEADGKADGAEIRVMTAGGFRDEFLDHDIEHGSCGEGKHIGEDGH